MNKRKVTVIIPSYGRPKMLQRAIKSVICQTYNDIEIIVVDDHSPEPLKAVVDNIDDDRIRYFRFNENKGANAARNKGIVESTGEYISFLDDDDVWKPTKVQKQVNILESNPTSGVIYTGQEYIDENGKTFKTKIPTASGDVKKYLFSGGSLAPFSCLMVRRSVIDKGGKLDPEMPSLQDREWLIRLSKYTKFYPVKEPLVMRQHGHERIGDNYKVLRDVTYPLLYKKHKSTAEEIGIKYRFYFKGDLLRIVGSSALRNGYYNDARKYLFKSLIYYPFSSYVALRLLIAIGGSTSYKAAKAVRDTYQRLRML